MRDWLQDEGHDINRKRVQRLMHEMGVQALYPKPRTNQSGNGQKIYPYLLRDQAIDRPKLVWATDISYIPMEKGFVYLVAVMSEVLSWRVSNSMEDNSCIEALEEALSRYGRIAFNTKPMLSLLLTRLQRL